MHLGLFLDENSTVPIYKQLAQRIEQRILAGELEPGFKLPSSRALAESLVVSRCTASKAYELLELRGLITSSPAVGTFVSQTLPNGSEIKDRDQRPAPIKRVWTAVPHRLSGYGCHIMSSETIEPADAELFPELNYCAPAAGQLPLLKWQEALVRASRTRSLESAAYRADALGSERLRKALAAYVLRTRGIRCSHDQIALFSGAQAALDLMSRLLINPGDVTAVENPGFPGVRRTFASHGACVTPVAVDKHGLMVGELNRLEPGASLVYITPSHHDPTGAVLSPARRDQLLRWAQSSQSLIIEDDFDCEYRYTDSPVPALYASDDTGCVIYLSSFWKVMFPVLQLGFVILPPQLVAAVKRAKSLIERDFHSVEHEALAQFIEEGHLERHIRRTRATYARRRLELIAQLNSHLGSEVKISPVSAGTHLLVHIDTTLPEDQILNLASRAGLSMVSTRPYYAANPTTREVLIPFAHVDESHLAIAVERFSSLL